MNDNTRASVPSDAPLDIGGRLATARRSAGLTQTDLADRVGLSRDQIATVERGRVPLRFGVGWEICRELNISQAWLITGRGSNTPFLDIDLGLSQDCIDERWQFTEVCRHVLRDRLNQAARNVEAFRHAHKHVPSVPEPMDELAIAWRRNRILRLRRQARSMANEAEKLEREIPLPEATDRGRADTSEKKMLPIVSPERKISGMTEMQLLLQRLKLASKGMKRGDIARRLKVPLPRLSEWLNGRVIPSGETTLRLLNWVEQQERKPTAPGGTSNATKGETQVRKSDHEKQTQVRKKG